LKREVRTAKIQNNPLGRVGLAIAKKVKENNKKGGRKFEGFTNDSPNAWFPK